MKKSIMFVLMVLMLTGCSKEGWREQTVHELETTKSEIKEVESNSYYSNMKWGNKIFVEGIAEDFTIKSEDTGFIEFTLRQENGNLWHTSVADDYINAENELNNKTIRIYGKFAGVDKKDLPIIVLNDDYAKITKKDTSGEYQVIWAFAGQNQSSQEDSVESSASNDTNLSFEDVSDGKPLYSYNGSGDDIVSGFVSPEKLSYAYIKHSGDGHFAVKAHYDDSYDLLANTTEPYDGKTLIIPNKEYTFEVNARGDWSIEVYELGTSLMDTFKGYGDFVTPIFSGTSETYEISSTGSGHFSVKAWTDKGYDLLVNTTDDNYSGKVLLKGSSKGAFFEINSSREWSIKPVK